MTQERPFRANPLTACLVGVALLGLSACSTLAPAPLSQGDIDLANQADRETARKDVQPVTGPLTLDEAMARALKYNLDRRVRLLEEAMALRQLDVTRLDMLPKLVAQAGYSDRSVERATFSSPFSPVYGPTSTDSSFSSAPHHSTLDLGLTWSLLDYGVGQYNARQQADRVLIAAEKRRKAMHLLMQDVRTAYWRAASAQQLRDDVTRTISLAEEALADSRKVEAERVRNPIDALRYQRQLLENLRLLEAINQELLSAQVDLANLVNAPLGQTIPIAEADVPVTPDHVVKLPVQTLEEVALRHNADLREAHYNARIARDETHKVMARMFPNLSFNYSLNYDSDKFLVDRNWQEAGLQLSFNFMNLLTGPAQKKLAEAGVALADQRRVATQMAVLTQVHLTRLQLLNARSQFKRSEEMYATDRRISELGRLRESAQAGSKLERVSNDTAAILSLLRRYQAMAQVQVAESRLLAQLGLEPQIGSTDELSLKDLTAQVKGEGNPWQRLVVSK
ncbi:TolC family protein [Hydrogenophaga sp.]|uniref:TolC family protein n=1 Tax=Hydrogenophaga sp. TaxID=1904254 RepID=UPI0035B3C0B5